MNDSIYDTTKDITDLPFHTVTVTCLPFSAPCESQQNNIITIFSLKNVTCIYSFDQMQ